MRHPEPIELLDVLNADGSPAGIRRPKADVHREGLWHRAVHVWIVTPERRVLLQKRSSSKENHPGLWDVSAAGHVAAGESPVEAARRETREELGIDLATSELHAIGSMTESWVLHDGRYIDHEHHDVFLVTRNVDLAMLELAAGEVDEVALVALEDFRRRVLERDASLVGHWAEYALLLDAAVV